MKKIYLLTLLIGLYCYTLPTVYAQTIISNQTEKSTKIEGLSIYPNPVNGDMIYITSDKNLTKTVTIFTVLGEKVLFKVLIGKALDISSLPPAVYVIRIKEGEKTATRKLVRN